VEVSRGGHSAIPHVLLQSEAFPATIGRGLERQSPVGALRWFKAGIDNCRACALTANPGGAMVHLNRMGRTHVHLAWGITCTLLLAWAVTLTALYAKEKGEQNGSEPKAPAPLLFLELTGGSVGIDIRPREGRLILHLEEIMWHGLAKAKQDGVTQGGRKIRSDVILELLNQTLPMYPGGLPAVLFEIPSNAGSRDPASVHFNFTVLSLSSPPMEGVAGVSLELLVQEEDKESGILYESEARVEHLQRPAVIEFYLPTGKQPQLMACIEDIRECAEGWTAVYDPNNSRLEAGISCTPRYRRYKDKQWNPDETAVAMALISSSISLLGMIPGIGMGPGLARIALGLTTAFMKSKTTAEDKWNEVRGYVEKYVAAEIKEVVDNAKLRDLQNALGGISEMVSDYYLYPNGSIAKGRTYYAVKAAMASWFGFFTDQSNPAGGLPYFIPYGTTYLSWRLQEILSYEEINGEPLSPELYNSLVESFKESMHRLQATPAAIRSQLLALRKQKIQFEIKTGFFHCDYIPIPWKITCGNIKVIDDGTGWTSKAHFFREENDDDKEYYYAHTLLYDLAVRLATFNLQVSLDDYLDASRLWSLLVPNNSLVVENTTQIYHTGLLGNLQKGDEFIMEDYLGGNLTKLKVFDDGHFLRGIQVWFDGESKGYHGQTSEHPKLTSQELLVNGGDYVDKVCGVASGSAIDSIKLWRNLTTAEAGQMIRQEIIEDWFYDIDTTATLQPTYMCGMRLGLFYIRKDAPLGIDTIDLTFCKTSVKVKGDHP